MSKARDLADSAQEINILDGKSFLDEDNLASDSATGIASQQSIKAYVDGITTTNITSTGALNSGSITSGFGNIDNGSSTITTTGAISGGSFVIGSADINENDLESIDGITAGTVSASKAVVVNTNKDITGFRNITATGTISGSLSGTLSGSLSSTTTATTQAESDDSTKVATTEYVSNKITTLIGGAPSTLNDLNELAAAINDDANYNSTLTTALATKLPLAGGTMTGDVLYNDNVKAKFGAGSDLQIYHTTTGNHSIIAESGAGNLILAADNLEINNAANNANKITAATGGAVTLFHNNAPKLATTSTGIQVTGNIANTSGDFTLDVAGDIILDADGADVLFHDGGLHYASIRRNGEDAVFKSIIQDKDIIFRGNDGGVEREVLRLDMSDAGTAIFNHDIKMSDNSIIIMGAGEDIEISSDGTNGRINAKNGNLTLDVAGEIELDSGNGDVEFKKNGVSHGFISNNSDSLQIYAPVSNKAILFKGNDNGNVVTALHLDMSDAGTAIFNHDIKLADNGRLFLGNDNDAQIYNTGSHTYIQNYTTNQDIIFNGVDDGSSITALTLDMSNAGRATFNENIVVGGTVDGRDVASDGSKLDGIATSANNYSHPTGAGNKHIPTGGSADQVLTYSSSGTAVWGDASGGSRVLITSSTMSSTSSYDFTSFNSSLYDTYDVEFEGITPSNGGGSNLQVYWSSDNLSTLLWQIESKAVRITGSSISGSNPGGYMQLANSIGDSSKNYGCSASGRFKIYNIHNAPTLGFSAEGASTFRTNGTTYAFQTMSCMADKNTPAQQEVINSFRIKFNSGTMVTGKIKVYGILK